MKTNLTLENVYGDGAKLGRVFKWLSRIGAAPTFGSRPIAWYQAHQIAAIDYLIALAGTTPLRCKSGLLQNYYLGEWKTLVSVRELFDIADSRSRN